MLSPVNERLTDERTHRNSVPSASHSSANLTRCAKKTKLPRNRRREPAWPDDDTRSDLTQSPGRAATDVGGGGNRLSDYRYIHPRGNLPVASIAGSHAAARCSGAIGTGQAPACSQTSCLATLSSTGIDTSTFHGPSGEALHQLLLEKEDHDDVFSKCTSTRGAATDVGGGFPLPSIWRPIEGFNPGINLDITSVTSTH